MTKTGEAGESGLTTTPASAVGRGCVNGKPRTGRTSWTCSKKNSMSATSGSGSGGSGGAVPLTSVARPACAAIWSRRLSSYLTWALVRFLSLLVTTTVRVQKSFDSSPS